jgi:ELWxxDGT repeat protein
MIRQIALFEGLDTALQYGLWETNGTVAETYELTGIIGALDSGVFTGGRFPDFTLFNSEILFAGFDANGVYGLWETNGTTSGTQELTGITNANLGGLFYTNVNPQFTLFNGRVLFDGVDTSGITDIWVTNGTALGTFELTGISGANLNGLNATGFTVFNGEVLFSAADASGNAGLWVTNGTALGTFELTGISNAFIGFDPSDFTIFNGEVLFNAFDVSDHPGLWVTNGTALGTFELTGISGISFSINPSGFTVFDGEVLFEGNDASGRGLWVTNGTAPGTFELTGISGASTGGLFSNTTSDFTVFNDEVLFRGNDISGHDNLWLTNGTAAGTHELTGITGLPNGLGGINPSDLTVFNGEVLFVANVDGGVPGLWETNGTASGTHRLNISGIDLSLLPLDLTSFVTTAPPTNDLLGNNTSDVLFRNNFTGDTWFEAISNGAFASWNQIGDSDTTYGVVGTGDFFGTGTSDILYRNNSTGETAFEATSNGAFAGWNQIGGSNTSYSVAGLGDFSGTGTSDILFRNISTGDTWFEQMGTNNDPLAGWHQIGGSDTRYSVVGVGDFFGTGADDILFRNNSTGDTWLEVLSNGALASWNQIGGSDTRYNVIGVGDFFGNGTNDILFRNSSTGDTWFEAISNGAFAGWNQIGGTNSSYSIVGIGDYFGNNTSDILFRNSAGDTWVEQITKGTFAGWNHIGGSNTAYTVPITVGPPALT